MSGEAARQYTWDDYQSWNDGQRWEVLGGEVYAMTPAPLPRHQWIQLKLAVQLESFLKDKRCQVLPAPIDVRLSDEDVVQPDLVVVCDRAQIKRTHIEGAPSLVVEILSPSTATYDRVRKLRLYARSGIKEVWLVTPYPWLAEVLVLDGENYRMWQSYERDDTLESRILPGLRITLREVFDFPLEPDEEVPMVKEAHPPYAPQKAE